MKVFIAISALIAAVSAQAANDFTGVAACAGPCWAPSANIKDCKVGDTKCWCGKAEIQDALKTCVPQKCTNKADVKNVYEAANKACVGATGFVALTPPA